MVMSQVITLGRQMKRMDIRKTKINSPSLLLNSYQQKKKFQEDDDDS